MSPLTSKSFLSIHRRNARPAPRASTTGRAGADARPPRASTCASGLAFGPSIDSLGQLPYDSYCIAYGISEELRASPMLGQGGQLGVLWPFLRDFRAGASQKHPCPTDRSSSTRERKRWKRLRRILDATAVVSTLVLAGFHLQRAARSAPAGAAAAHSPAQLQGLARHVRFCAAPKTSAPRAAKPAASPPRFPSTPAKVCAPPTTCRTTRPATPRSRSTSTRSTCSFPQWLHVDSPQGTLMVMSGDNLREYPVIEGATVHDPDDLNKVKHVIQAATEDTEIFPALNNFNPHTQNWDTGVGDVLQDPDKSAALRQQIMRFLTAYPAYRGLSLDIESLPDEDDPGLPELHPGALCAHARAQSAALRQRRRGHQRQRPQGHRRQLRRHHADELRRAPDHQRSRTHRQPGVVRRQPASACSRSCPRKSSSAAWATTATTGRSPSPIPRTAVTASRRSSIPMISPSPTPGSAPPTPTPISISITTRSILTSSTSTRTPNQRHVVWFLDGVTLLERDARRARARPADLCPLAPGRGRQLAVEHLGPAQQIRLAAGARHRPARPRRGHRGRRRHSARHRPAPARQAHRRSGYRRARPAQEAHRR